MKELKFKYRNHRGEISERRIVPDALELIVVPDPKYYNQPGWFLSGYDLDKKARRSFSLPNIVFEQTTESGYGYAVMKLRFEDDNGQNNQHG